jgi:hypothetical protein
MKRTTALVFAFTAAMFMGGCADNEPEPEQQSEFLKDVDDISSSSEITPYGGEIEVADGNGNHIEISFPPGAIRDTTTVTLTLLGTYRDLPIDERRVRVIEIGPSDLSLYRPASITIQYNKALEEIEQAAIFHLRSDELLVPLSDHEYPAGNTVISAETMILGEFTEGNMTLEQVSDQVDLLLASLGITWKGTGIAVRDQAGLASGCEEYKASWDSWMMCASGLLKLFEMWQLKGHYGEPGRGSFDEDVNRVCSDIIEPAINDVLDQGEPADPCCSDYAHTIEAMMQAALACGMGGPTLDNMNAAYDKVHSECHTYLDITTEVDIESTGLLIMTTGEVMLSLAGIGDGEASVTGTGELTVAGSGHYDQCSSTISGQTFAAVTGIRDAAYVYTLTVQLDQYAIMVTVCPQIVDERQLTGGSSREITLGPGNGFSIVENEIIDEGTATVQASINNPYVPVRDPE